MVISSQNEMMNFYSSLLDIMMDKTILVLLRTYQLIKHTPTSFCSRYLIFQHEQMISANDTNTTR